MQSFGEEMQIYALKPEVEGGRSTGTIHLRLVLSVVRWRVAWAQTWSSQMGVFSRTVVREEKRLRLFHRPELPRHPTGASFDGNETAPSEILLRDPHH